MGSLLKIFLCGDVMTGRGIDQILPHSVDPTLHEYYVQDARRYVQLALEAGAQIPEHPDSGYPWGEAVEILNQQQPDCRIINLETAITTSDTYWESKGIHYRMHPENTDMLNHADIDLCVLGNNHVLDWGYSGMQETLSVLQKAGIQFCGAGHNANQAGQPALCDIGERQRLLVFSYGLPSAGVHPRWAAQPDQGGVNFLRDLSDSAFQKVHKQIQQWREPDDLVIISIHWGKNWGYHIPEEQRTFAHRLIEESDVDIIHGHSSHHIKGVEVYQGRPVFYGCGDLLNDYEGIAGHDRYRGELGLMYFPVLQSETGELERLEMVPTHIRNFRIQGASPSDSEWIRTTLQQECEQFNCRVTGTSEGTLLLHW